jgi:hypothetical protein
MMQRWPLMVPMGDEMIVLHQIMWQLLLLSVMDDRTKTALLVLTMQAQQQKQLI